MGNDANGNLRFIDIRIIFHDIEKEYPLSFCQDEFHRQTLD